MGKWLSILCPKTEQKVKLIDNQADENDLKKKKQHNLINKGNMQSDNNQIHLEAVPDSFYYDFSDFEEAPDEKSRYEKEYFNWRNSWGENKLICAKKEFEDHFENYEFSEEDFKNFYDEQVQKLIDKIYNKFLEFVERSKYQCPNGVIKDFASKYKESMKIIGFDVEGLTKQLSKTFIEVSYQNWLDKKWEENELIKPLHDFETYFESKNLSKADAKKWYNRRKLEVSEYIKDKLGLDELKKNGECSEEKIKELLKANEQYLKFLEIIGQEVNEKAGSYFRDHCEDKGNEDNTYIHEEIFSTNIRPWFKEHDIEDTPISPSSNNMYPKFVANGYENYRDSFMVVPMVMVVGLFVGKYVYEKFMKKAPDQKRQCPKQKKQAQEEQN